MQHVLAASCTAEFVGLQSAAMSQAGRIMWVDHNGGNLLEVVQGCPGPARPPACSQPACLAVSGCVIPMQLSVWASSRRSVLQAVLRRMQSEVGPRGPGGSSADMHALQDQLRSVAQETTALKRQSERMEIKLLR